MFNNTGNDTFTHVAKYNETYQLLKMNQSGGVMDNTAEAVFQPDAGSAVGSYFPCRSPESDIL